MSDMQQRAYLARIYHEHEQISKHLEAQRKEYEERENYLDAEQRKLQSLKEENLMATQAQNQAFEDMMRLAEQQQREKDGFRKKIRDLEQKLNDEQALELEIKRMWGDLQVMGHMREGEDPDMKKKIEMAEKELKDREEEMDYQEMIYQTLVEKHGYTNEELQDARKALINSMLELTNRAHIGVKRMGELDEKPFHKVAKEKYPAEKANVKANELCSLWNDYLRDSQWHPFKVMPKDDGTYVEVVIEEDEKLQGLKKEMGEEVVEAVIQALRERNEYNGSARYIVPELWNFREGRKASLKEGVVSLLTLWEQKKPKETISQL